MERATFTALRFPVGPVDSERVDSSVSTEGRTSLRNRHLLSPLNPLPFILTRLPWRTFILSTRLPHGVWLLRRLRPPSGTLAFLCPPSRGLAVSEFPDSRRQPANREAQIEYRRGQPSAASICAPAGYRGDRVRAAVRRFLDRLAPFVRCVPSAARKPLICWYLASMPGRKFCKKFVGEYNRVVHQ